MTAESDLLLACARKELDDDRAGRLPALASGVGNWDLFRRLAEGHGLLPLAARHLTLHAPAGLPEEVRGIFEKALRDNARVNAFLLQEAVRLPRLLAGRSIGAVPFKGPLFADEFYGDLALRPVGDLDFIVSRSDVQEAANLLAGEGYRRHLSLEPHLRRAYESSYYAFNFTADRSGIVVDLHWELARRFLPPALGPLGWQKRLRRRPYGDGEMDVLGREDTLLLLSLHGTRHRWERLVWLIDVAEVVRAGIDWDLLFTLADGIHGRRSLLCALALAGRFAGAALPRAVREKVEREGAAARLAGTIETGLFEEKARESLKRAVGKGLFQLRSLDRTRDRVRFLFLWALLPNLNDWQWVTLPEALGFLYFPLRLVRLGLHYGRRLLSPAGA